MSQERQTIHTFKNSPTCAQLLAYITVTGKCIIFTACVQNSFINQTNRIIITSLYFTSFLSLIYFWIVTSKCDPSDPYLYESLSKFGKKTNQSILYCQKCKSFVQQSSLHCKLCNRCIVGFDHHCVWINNCIGSNNYKIFIGMIFSALVNLALFLVGITMLWNEGEWNYFIVKMIISWIAGGVVAVFVLLILALVSFHIYLICKGKTTYEFLMEDKIKKIIPQAHQQPLKQQRGPEIAPQINNSKASAVQYHKNGLIFQLNQSDSHSQSKSNSHLEMKKEDEKQKNESEQSPSQTQGQIAFRRNKSFDFLIGRCDVERESRAVQNNYKSLHRGNSRLFTEDISGQIIKKNNQSKMTITVTFNK